MPLSYIAFALPFRYQY